MVNPGQKLELQHMVDLAAAASTSGVPGAPYYFRPRIHLFRVSDSELDLVRLPDVAVGHLACNTMTREMWVLNAHPASNIANWSLAANWVVVADIAARNALTTTNGLNVFVVTDTTPATTKDPHNHYVWRPDALPAAAWEAYRDWFTEWVRLLAAIVTTGNDYRTGQRIFAKTGPYYIRRGATFINGYGTIEPTWALLPTVGSLGPKYYEEIKFVYPTNEATGRNLTTRIDPEVTSYDDGEYYRGGFALEDIGAARITGGMAVQLASNSGSSFVLSGATGAIVQQTIQTFAGPIYYLNLRFDDDVADGEFYIGIKAADGWPTLPSGVWRSSFSYGGPIVTLENTPLSSGVAASGLHSEAGLSELAAPDAASYPLTGATSPRGIATGQNTGAIQHTLVPAPSVALVKAKTPALSQTAFNVVRGPFTPLESFPALAPYARQKSPLVADAPTDPSVTVAVDNALPTFPVIAETDEPFRTYLAPEVWGVVYSLTVARTPRLNGDGLWEPDQTGSDVVVDVGQKVGEIFRPTGTVTLPAGQASKTFWPQWPVLYIDQPLHYRSSEVLQITAAVALGGMQSAGVVRRDKRPILADHYNGWLATVEAY